MRLLNSKPRIIDLRKKHLKRNSNTILLEKPAGGTATFVQDAANCWMYGVFNSLKVNTNIEVNPDDVKKLLQTYSLKTDVVGDKLNSAAAVCELYGAKCITVDILKQTKTFAENIKKGYSFVYDRNCDTDFLMDIIDNGKIDRVHGKSKILHTTTGILSFPTIKELGSWGNKYKANSFTYDNLLTFVACVKAGAIKSEVLFLYK